jgi:signal transduction histidine kinase
MESFLDEYQRVRLGMTLAGLVLVTVLLLTGRWADRIFPIALVLVVATAHALWAQLRAVRAPRVMLFIDLTLWGWVMTQVADVPAVPTASLAFLTLLTALFTTGAWTPAFLGYLSTWYGIAYFTAHDIGIESAGELTAVVFTIAPIAVVVARIGRWLTQVDANRSQMLGTVSHELRNNLTGVLGLTEVVVSDETLDDAEARELIVLAHQQAVEATEIVEDLLTVSRLERSALVVHLEPVDIGTEVATVARRFAGEGTEVVVDGGGALAPVNADPLRVRQILRNLISNAVRYGGPRIEVTTRLGDGVVEVVVCDDGDGVPQEDETTIFLPYRRSTVTRRDPSSIGLGLWICRQLAVAMGGSLAYRRSDGETQFVLSLPGAASPATAASQPIPAARAAEADPSPVRNLSLFDDLRTHDGWGYQPV